MIQLKTILDVADNTGARKASLIGVLKSKGKGWAKVGDIVKVNVKESTPDAVVKKGSMAKGIIVRTKKSVRRQDGTYVRFDSNAVVIIDDAGNPKGTRVFGPVARELRNMEFMKIISLAPEVV
ncbi:MAG: 50S ribosomal protein L14 [Candidatus Omnitrophica bacterium]|nr:50S ribosomal protein L14 [Candidatus Omnitrophota bacterium]MDE2008513.1 50S ribosomal protein L14 [Candidatus Omnitrophota bacterium]MDE2213979.1 50S ribosomal protein L14 [Candidatus Omnitrophota bacterium]MDE2231366.1 50S ribosomal protein L14 [Candidatus Omnitrophota bacterium]